MRALVTAAVILALAGPAAAKGAQPLSPAQCAQIRNAVKTFGITLVLAGATARGYSSSQVAYARSRCHV